MKYLFAVCCLLWATLASAQQSERFDEFELHYSIVYSTFLTPILPLNSASREAKTKPC